MAKREISEKLENHVHLVWHHPLGNKMRSYLRLALVSSFLHIVEGPSNLNFLNSGSKYRILQSISIVFKTVYFVSAIFLGDKSQLLLSASRRKRIHYMIIINRCFLVDDTKWTRWPPELWHHKVKIVYRNIISLKEKSRQKKAVALERCGQQYLY